MKSTEFKFTKMMGLFITAFVLVILNLNVLDPLVSKSISFLFSPIIYTSSSFGDKVEQNITSLVGFLKLSKENNELKVENSILKAENLSITLLIEENASLRKELDLGNREAALIKAEVMKVNEIGDLDSLTINLGEKDGVKEGDVAKLGNQYIGIVSKVNETTSRIKLPNNSGSFLEVEIIRKEKDNTKIKGSGVAIGSLYEIIIENILNESDVEIGDPVILVDERIGDLLLLGTIQEVLDDPTATGKKARVKSLIDYRELSYLFIERQND